jgi:hypothetical protein
VVKQRVVNSLVWAGLALGVWGVLVVFGPDRSATPAPAPGHDAAGCGLCRSDAPLRGPALPFEIDGDNVRSEARRATGPGRPGLP